jgi:hypothetical protein
MKIGPVFRAMAEGEPDWISSIAGRGASHPQGMGAQAADAKKAHPLTLLRKAYAR